MIFNRNLLILSLSLFVSGAFAQTFICDTLTTKSEGSLVVAAIQLNECLEEISDIDQAKQLVQVLSLDAVKYYDLTRLYDTDDKMNAFKQSKAYKDSLAALTKLKQEKLNGYYYSVLTNNLGKFSWSFKGFKFDMDVLTTAGGVIGAPPAPSTMFYDIDLRSLPFTLTPQPPGKEGGPDQHMVITVDPEMGMKIERNKDSLKVIVAYKLDVVTSKEYTYYNFQCHCSRVAKENVILTKNNRIIIFNDKSNEVYFDKNF